MSQRITWGQIKNQVGQPIGLSSSDPNLLCLVNEASEILWAEGDWIGKNQRYKIRVTADCHRNKCLTWPRQVETIEAINLCNRPIGVRTQYFEFMENAIGEIGARTPDPYPGFNGLNRNSIPLLGDRSEVVLCHDIIPGQKKVIVSTERIEPTGRILLLGYDDNGNWIRTQDQYGNFSDGEWLNLADAPATTANYFSSITGVQFDKTPRNGNTYLFSIDPNGNQLQLATYDYSVSVPVFRRSILGNLPYREWAYDTNEQWRGECVTALVKTRYMPIIFDTDYVQIGNIAALKAMLQYIYKRDNDKIQDAEAYKQEAIMIMNNDLKQYNGYGSTKSIRFLNKSVWGASPNLY